MRLITFDFAGRPHWGAIQGDYAVDLNLAHALFLASRSREPVYLANSALEFIQRGEEAWAQARETLQYLGDRFVEGVAFPMDRIHLHAPMPRPPKILCIGHNYMAHVREQNAKVPTAPVVFAKFPTAVTGPYDTIHLHPAVAQKVDWEGELGVVIGKTGTGIQRGNALDYVFGFTVVNDVSARDVQYAPESNNQWVRGKSFDTYCPCGPAIVTRDEVPNPHGLAVTTTVNGRVMQEGNTDDFIFDIPTLIEFLSNGITLEPGDIISTGSPPGVGHWRKPPVYLKPGDVVRVDIAGIGHIQNPVEE